MGLAFYNHCNINNTKHNRIADDKTKQYLYPTVTFKDHELTNILFATFRL